MEYDLGGGDVVKLTYLRAILLPCAVESQGGITKFTLGSGYVEPWEVVGEKPGVIMVDPETWKALDNRIALRNFNGRCRFIMNPHVPRGMALAMRATPRRRE